MRLTAEQKEEIKEYIVTVPRFRETFNELYDHLLNSFENSDVEYSIDEVVRVINTDFGGFSEIVEQEKSYQKELSKKYNKHFRQEILNTFKWPGVLNNLCCLAICLVIYYGSDHTSFNIKPMVIGIVIGVAGIAVFGFYKIIINRYSYSKYSILDNYFGYSCSFGFIMVNASLHFLNKNSPFSLGDTGRLLLLLSLFFFYSVYVRAFLKFYNQKIKVLTS